MRTHRSLPLAALLASSLAVGLAACATSAARPSTGACPVVVEAPPKMPPGHGHGGRRFDIPKRIVDARSGTVLDEGAVFADLAASKVVYVGEQHDDPHHHAVQVSVIAGLYHRDPSLAIGMEMFKAPFQAAVDAYVLGEIDEEALLERTEWDERWGFDFDLYRGVMEFARAHKIRVIALNAPDELTRKVAKVGVAGLSKAERDGLPELDLKNAEHRAMMQEVFEGHHGGEAKDFENFYAAQVLWDETMAAGIAKVLGEKDGPHRMVVLAGDGHVRHGYGIPARAARRGAAPFRTIVPISLSSLEETLPEAAGNYLWVMAMREEDFIALDSKASNAGSEGK